MEALFETLLIVMALGGLVYLANLATQRPILEPLVYGTIGLINLLLLAYALFILADDTSAASIAAAGILLTTVSVAGLLLIPAVRVRLVPIFPRLRNATAYQSTGVSPTVATNAPTWLPYAVLSDGDVTYMPQSVNTGFSMPAVASSQPVADDELLGFDPYSLVHAMALILMVYVMGTQIAFFIIEGGLSEFADDFEITYWSLLPNFVPFVIGALLGVGWLSRRTWGDALRRLGLTPPSIWEIGIGVGAAIGLFFLQGILGAIWLVIVGPEAFEDQTEASGAIAESINTIGLAFAVAFTAGVGEEIAFRGALQPIFGLWWTAIFFTAIHMQYTLTPAALIIFVVAVAFGYLRRFYSLYTVIIAHFLYNFIQLFLNVLLQ